MSDTVTFTNGDVPEGTPPIEATIGQYADYLDTGVWDVTPTGIIAPKYVTLRQIKDFLLASGGAVYLREDNRFGWIQTEKEKD